MRRERACAGGDAPLHFTLIGPAVNLTPRIESMCKSLNRSPLLSAKFARASDVKADLLGTLALKGVGAEGLGLGQLSSELRSCSPSRGPVGTSLAAVRGRSARGAAHRAERQGCVRGGAAEAAPRCRATQGSEIFLVNSATRFGATAVPNTGQNCSSTVDM
jgi:hypothetical protein